MRDLTAPDGTAWEVFLEWEGRKPLSRSFRRFRSYREARAKKRGKNKADSLLDGCDIFSGVDADLPVVAVVFIVVMLLVVFGPGLFLLLFGIVEIGLLLAAVIIALSWRTLARRPWRIAAVSHHGDVWAWNRTGFWGSRRLVHSIADGLERGEVPQLIEPELLEADTPTVLAADPYLGPTAQPWVRWLSAVVVVASVAAIVMSLASRF